MPHEADGLASLSLAIGAIVFLLWGAVWVLRRVRPGLTVAGVHDCAIIRSLTLGPRERLVVVRVGKRNLVVGVSASAVSLLCELEEPLVPVAPASERFGEAIRGAAKRWHGE
jgi:flagellar protein FliO/FliZ